MRCCFCRSILIENSRKFWLAKKICKITLCSRKFWAKKNVFTKFSHILKLFLAFPSQFAHWVPTENHTHTDQPLHYKLFKFQPISNKHFNNLYNFTRSRPNNGEKFTTYSPGLLRFQNNRPSNARKFFKTSLKRTQKNAKNAKFSKTVFFKRKSTKNQVFTGFCQLLRLNFHQFRKQ